MSQVSNSGAASSHGTTRPKKTTTKVTEDGFTRPESSPAEAPAITRQASQASAAWQSASIPNPKQIQEGLHSYVPHDTPPPFDPPSKQPQEEKLELLKQFAGYKVSPLLSANDGRAKIASFVNEHGGNTLVARNREGKWVKVFEMNSDEQGRVFDMSRGKFRSYHHKEGEYIEISAPVKHTGGKIEFDANGAAVIGDDYSYIRVNVNNPSDIQIVAKEPGFDIRRVIRDPDTGDIMAHSYLDHANDLSFQWSSNNEATQEKLNKLKEAIKSSENRDANISIEHIELSKVNGVESWSAIASYSDMPRVRITFDYDETSQSFIEQQKEYANPDRKEFNFTQSRKVTLKGETDRELSALLTLPPGKTSAKDLPVVVMAHGGPYMEIANIQDGYMQTIQTFASQGYAVLSVNHAGSTGHGAGLMLDLSGNQTLAARDMISATEDALTKGLIDGKRMHIYGSSFGGYTSLKVAELVSGTDKESMFKSCIAEVPVPSFEVDVQKKEDDYKKEQKLIEEYRKDHSLDQLAEALAKGELKRTVTPHIVAAAKKYVEVGGAVKPKINIPVQFITGTQNGGDGGSMAMMDDLISQMAASTPTAMARYTGSSHMITDKLGMLDRITRLLGFLIRTKHPLREDITINNQRSKTNPILTHGFAKQIID